MLLTLNGWQMSVDDKLKYDCFMQLGKVNCIPPLNTKTTEETVQDYERAKDGGSVPAYYVNVMEHLTDLN